MNKITWIQYFPKENNLCVVWGTKEKWYLDIPLTCHQDLIQDVENRAMTGHGHILLPDRLDTSWAWTI